MRDSFLVHIAISAIIFAILASGFRFYVRLKGTLDFSYLAIVIFASYTAALCNIHRDIGILASIAIAFALSLLFTFFVLYLSSRLDDVYFTIWTLALYILAYQLAFNLEWITGGALWMSGMNRNIIGDIFAPGLQPYLIFSAIIGAIIFAGLLYFKRTYLYRILQWWGENAVVIKSLGVQISWHKLIMIGITTLLASIGWWLYSFYYLYIDPPTFWLGMLILLITISFVSYKRNDLGVLLVSFIVLLGYEYLRFFKVVDAAKVGYLREIIFGLLIIIVAFVIFRKTSFGRSQ